MTMKFALVTALAINASPCLAQEATPSRAERDRITAISTTQSDWRSYSPSMGWRMSSEWQSQASAVSIYIAPGHPTRGTVRYVARRELRRADEADVVEWADSVDCPSLQSIAESYETIETPKTVIWGRYDPPRFPAIILHGGAWTIWTNIAQQEGSFPAHVSMTASSGPIVEWIRAGTAQLQDCWQPDEPPEKHPATSD